jgi:hypothetical protein
MKVEVRVKDGNEFVGPYKLWTLFIDGEDKNVVCRNYALNDLMFHFPKEEAKQEILAILRAQMVYDKIPSEVIGEALERFKELIEEHDQSRN